MKIVKMMAVLATAILLCASTDAEETTGTITGRVFDKKTEKPLAYANIVVVGTTRGAMSLASGRFEIKNIKPGTYEVKALMMGYKTIAKRNVVVVAGEVTELSFGLQETIVAEMQRIDVFAERKASDVSQSEVRGSATDHKQKEIPVDNAIGAVPLKTGIIKMGDDLHVRGGRSGEIQTQPIDGTPAHDPLGKSQSARPSPPGTKREQPNRSPQEKRKEAPVRAESYVPIYENDFEETVDKPYSTFSIDVDAASYSNMRRFIQSGFLPPRDAVRIEELINYFAYDYPEPDGRTPFSISSEVAECPWTAGNKLVRVGLKGRSIDIGDVPPSNLVFVLDVSGSMKPPNKLPLLRRAFVTLTEQLRPQDRVGIVVYSSSAVVVLESTPGSDKEQIANAIVGLAAGGSTAGGAGIRLAYDIATEHFIKNGNNRVILATDGDFNTGPSSDSEMIRLIEEKRESGVFLTVLGFGEANLKDSKLEGIADHGNGYYFYIDDIFEARRVLVHQLSGALFTIAKDVKIQIEFNPAKVTSYRLLGYENRLLAKKDFDDDKKDAGDIGAGHCVTALYEIVPAVDVQRTELARTTYVSVSINKEAFDTPEIATVRLRYKEPRDEKSKLLVDQLMESDAGFDNASGEFRFASAVAEFGLLLRSSQFAGKASLQHVLDTAKDSAGEDEGGYRHEFVRLVEKCRELAGE